MVMLSAFGVLAALTPVWMKKMQALVASGMRFDARMVASPDAMVERLGNWTVEALWLVIPLALCIIAGSLASSIVSGGWNFTLKALAPKFGKLNPLQGIGRMFSMQQLTDAIKACSLGIILGASGVYGLYKAWPSLANLMAQPLPLALAELGNTVWDVLSTMLLVLAAFAIVDLPLQKFMFAKRMRMSHQDVKDEHKQQEGNQEIKGRIRQLMREASRKRMLAAVPTADLVVMNPTHYAVALKYDDATMNAPRVVAKGLDLLALRIRDLATEHKVPVLEAPPLARALYANAEIDAEVPMALYNAVAQVMAYVYQLKAALAGEAPLPGNMPDLEVPDGLDPLFPAKAQA